MFRGQKSDVEKENRYAGLAGNDGGCFGRKRSRVRWTCLWWRIGNERKVAVVCVGAAIAFPLKGSCCCLLPLLLWRLS